jgi:hypothetical protein
MLCFLSFNYGNENTKKETLSVELHFTLWPIWLLQNIFLLSYSLKIHDPGGFITLKEI